MDTVLKKAIIRIIIIGISNGIIWACPTVMDLESDLGDTVIVGQTVTFTASCDVAPQGYNWVLPSSAYNISGTETAQVSCKFNTVGNYPIQVYFLYAGNSYGPASLSISVLASKPIWYVSPNGEDDNDGQSWESAFRTIQTAIDLALPGHEIIVSEGTYRERISLKGKDLTIHSSDPENWSVVQNTIINGHGQGSVVFFNGSETTDCLFKGFTVMGGGILYEDPLNNYLEGHWELDENTGTEVPDSSGKEHNGDFKPDGYGPIWDSAGGRTAGCLSFDGEDYVEMGNYYGVGGTAARTTCAWIKLPSSGSSRTILSYGGTTYRSEWLFMVNADNKLQLSVYEGNIIGSPVLATNRWYHVAAVLDDWNGDGLKVNDLRLYIDGKQVTGSYYNPNEALSTGNSYPVRIGSHVSTNYKFIGQIDDVRLYNKALTESEIRSLAGDVGKVVHWKLDNGSGNTATDSSGNEFDGTLTGNPGWEVGKLGSCLLFDGDDHVVVPGFTGISGEQPRTVCAWIQTNQASEGMILTYGTIGTGKRWMLFVNNNHKLQLGVNGGNTYSAQVIADGQWHHVAALLDPPVSGPAKVQNLRLYIDGQIAERFYTNPNQEINTEIAANYPVRIGANQISPGGGLGGYFNGKIDDVRLYSRALSEAEIRAIYSQGGGFCGNGTQAAISNCVIRDNDNLLDGGGIRSVDGDITNCFIIHNTSVANGGGLADCDGLITNCVIADNEAVGGGALSNCNGEIVNCSIVNNRTHISGILDRCTGSIANCILWNNTGTLLTYSAPTYSCFPCGSGNNLNANPQFRSLSDLKGADEIFGTEDDGLILQGGSPCLDTGNNSFVPFDISEDITGRNRKLDGDHDQSSVVDMGAYETPRIWYVDCNVASSGDGKTWATAKKTIQEGIHASQDGDVVLVADGTYTGGVYNDEYKDPNRNRDLDFEGRAITLQSQNGPGACIIDCEGGDSDPHRGFYFHSNEGPDSVVHGFTIQNGYVNSSHPYPSYTNGCGGAIACGDYMFSPPKSASPTITNCIFRNNYAQQYGGGVFCTYSDANIINSIFVANKAGSNGGGMYSKFNCNNKILNCTFIKNYAEGNGGGLYVISVDYVHVDVTNSIFWGNKNKSTFDQIEGTSNTVVSYSCIQGGLDSNSIVSIENIAEYPNFIDADADDFYLQAGSPCIDAGTNLTVPLLFYVDLDGNPRRIDDPSTQDTGYGQPPIADMGAYEYRPPTSPDTNNPPQVNAGTDKIVKVQNWLDLSDAIASGQEPLTYLWTSSPDSVQFDPPGPQDSNTSADLHPQVRFYEVGEYSLQLLADDGQDTAADTLAVTVVSVHAGPSQIIYLPSNQVRLNATIQGPALASVQWSVVPEFSPSAEVAFSAYSISDYNPNATFTEPGRYMLRITAEFAGFEGILFSDETIVTVKIDDNPANPANNTAPTVSAWAEPTAITWPVNTTYLVGRVSDDGRPDGRLSVRWSPVSWPIDGGVTFGTYSVADPNTTATFSRPGAYELLLTADDGDKQTSQPVLVTVLPPDTQPNNDPPTASAGGNRTIHRSPFSPFTFTPNSYADDLTPTGYLSIQWTVIEGPQGGLALSDPTAAQTQITFFQTGTWTLLLTVSDGQYTVTDQATITVTTDPVESAFKITAGPDQTITFPAWAQLADAAVTFAESNEPYPLENVSVQWSKVAGPGDIEFFIPDNSNHPAPHTELNPSLRFSKAGKYTLQLLVSEVNIILFDEIDIKVKPGTRITGGEDHTLIIDENDNVWACGSNEFGQLGNGVWGDSEYESVLVPVKAGEQGVASQLTNIDSVAAGWVHSLALDKEGVVWAWGSEKGDDNYINKGQLGNGLGDTTPYYPTPRKVLSGDQGYGQYLSSIVSIATGRSGTHSLAVDSKGYAWSWGNDQVPEGWIGDNRTYDPSGQLGNADEGDRQVPGRVLASLEGHWKFDNNSYKDSSGYERHGDTEKRPEVYPKLYPNDQIGGTAKFGEKDDYDDYDDYIEILENYRNAYKGISGKDSRTICAWIKIPSTVTAEGVILFWGDDSGVHQKWCISVTSEGKLKMEITDTDWIIGDNNPEMNLCDDLWHHIAIVHREECPAIKNIKMYADGMALTTQVTGNSDLEIMTPALCNVQIGRSLTNGDGADYFKGYIGDLQLYSVALPDREIQRISYMVEDYWDFEDTSFSGNNDVGNKTNGYHGTCYNAKRVYNPDAFIIGTKGLELTGNNSYVKMEGHKGITGSSSRTVSAWIRKTDDQNGTIISWGSATGAGKSWVFGVYDGKLRLSIDSVNYIEGSTVLDYGPNKWYFVAATVDKGKPTLGDVKLYVDGKEEITSVPTHSDADTSIKTEDGQDICIGTWNGSDYFKGYIDDVKIYPSSLREEDFALMPLYPGAVASLSNIVSVSGGAFHSIFLENNHSSAGSAGKVYVSGKNSEWGGYRLLGCGDQRDRAETPVAVRRHNPDVHELHYRFGNAFKVSIIKNEVGFGRDGELIGNIESSVRYIPCYWKDNKNFDRYYSFQEGAYIKVNDYKGILSDNSRTATAWINISDNKDQYQNPVDIDIINWGNGSEGQQWRVCIDPDGHLTVHVNNTSFLSADIPISVGPDSEWNHVAVVFDTGQLSDIQLYINGVQSGTTLHGEDVSINTDSGDNVIVGNPPNGCSIQIADLQVYSIPLLDWEVSWLSDPNYSVRTARLQPLDNITQVSAGWYHSLAVENYTPGDNNKKGRVYSWGEYFKPGIKYGTFSAVPILLNEEGEFLEGIVSVSSGLWHSIALDSEGHVWAWGTNDSMGVNFGNLGIGSSDEKLFPVKVKAPDLNGNGVADDADEYGSEYLKDIIAISAGYWHCLAMDIEGQIWSWGLGYLGRLGISDTTSYWPPIFGLPKKVLNNARVLNITQNKWYNQIQDAVDDADPDGMDEIIVYPGIYHENIDIGDKSLTLKSLNPDDPEIIKHTIISGQDTQNGITIGRNAVDGSETRDISINVTISGFTIENYLSGIVILPSWDKYSSSGYTMTINANIQNNRIINNLNNGIRIVDESNLSLSPDVLIINPVIRNNTLQNNGCGGINYANVYLSYIDAPVIAENIIEGGASIGVHLNGCQGSKINNNKISGNAAYGLNLAGCEDFEILNNLISENGISWFLDLGFYYGVHISQGYGRFDNNTVVNNGMQIYAFPAQGKQTNLQGNILWGQKYESRIISISEECPVGYSCLEAADPGNTTSIYTDPDFVNIWQWSNVCNNENNYWSPVFNNKARIVNSDISKIQDYAVGQILEYNWDETPRIITDVNTVTNYITFAPALQTEVKYGSVLFNWGESIPKYSEVVISDVDKGVSTLYVTDIDKYQSNHVLSIGGDWYVVTAVDSQTNSVSIDPPLMKDISAGSIINNHSYGVNLKHDYRLKSTSSCVNAGNPDYIIQANETDLDGHARILDGCVDIGAYEYCAYSVNAGEDFEVGFGALAAMDNAQFLQNGSSIPLPSSFSVVWQMISKPAESTYPLNQPLATALNPAFELDALGQYTFKLSAYDQNTNLIGADTVTVLVGLSVDASAGAPYEATLVYDPSSGLCSALVELVGRVRGADPERIQILWGDPDYAVSHDPVLWEQGDSLYISKNITFYNAGAYEIPLEVFDRWGRPLDSDTAVVTIHGPNFEVDAGTDRRIDWDQPSVSISLYGKVIGYPFDEVDLHWRQISGPVDVLFDPALPGDFSRSGVHDPSVTFTQPGHYKFQFVAERGWERRVDDLNILVGNGILLSAGEDLYGRLEDGQVVVTTRNAYVYPNDGSLTIQWYHETDLIPGANQPNGSFRFNTPGDHVLTLKAWDAKQEWTDSIIAHIYQNPFEQPGQTSNLYITAGLYEPIVLEDHESDQIYAWLWLKNAFYDVVPQQPLTCRWSVSDPADAAYVFFVNSLDGGRTSTILNPDVIFTQDGYYWLKLEVFSSQGEPIGSAETCINVLSYGTTPPDPANDQTPPQISLTAVQNGIDITGRMLTHGRIHIAAHAVDSDSGLQILRLLLVNEKEEEKYLTEVSDQVHYPANLDLYHTLEVVGLSPGRYKLKAQGWDRVPNYGFAELVFDVNVPTTGQLPTAEIRNLDSNLIIEEGTANQYKQLPVIDTGFFELRGIASHPAYNNPPQDQNLRYKLDLYGKSGQSNTSNDWNYVGPVRIVDKTREADGYYHGPITDPDRFGQIDLTGFENGVYQLKLTVQVPGNYDWLSSDAYAQFILNSPLKIGQVKFTQEDLVIPVGGIPIRILRTYNSFQRHQDGPFGHGWAYTIAGMDIELNEQRIPMPLYEDRYQMYSIRVSDNFDRNVTLTLPDGQKVTFQFYLKYDKGSWGEFGDYVAKYRSPQGITDKLETLKQERFKVNPDVGGFGYLWNGQGGDVQGTQDPAHYDFSGYRLTTADGTKYVFKRQDYGFSSGGELFGYDWGTPYFVNPRGDLYLSEIQSPTGEIINFNINPNTCQIGTEGIEHYYADNPVATKAVKFEYDVRGRIKAVYAPTEQGGDLPTIRYVYDEAGNLSEVRRLTDKNATDPSEQYQTLRYLYDDIQHDPGDHYITGILDPRGIQPIRYIYDAAGRLTETQDANGNTIQLSHDGYDQTNGRYEEVKDRSGNTSLYFYDLRGNVALVQKFDSSSAVIDYARYEYDTNNLFRPDRPILTAVPHRLVDGLIEESVTRYNYEYYDNSGEEGYGGLHIETIIDPDNNLTKTYYDPRGNVTQVVQGKNAVDFVTPFEKLTTSHTKYTDTNLPYLTGITTGSEQDQDLVWHTLSVTWYDTLSRITHTAQVNTDAVSYEDLFDGGNLKPVDTVMQALLAGSSVTSYFYDEEWSGSPDQPYCVVDPAGNRQYFHYDQNNAQDASWTLWDDPADPDSPNKFVMNLAVTDDQGRPLQSYRLVDQVADPERPDPNVVNIYAALSDLIDRRKAVLQSTTIYNSIGQADRTIDADGVTTQYEYDALGQLVQTLVYESENARDAHYPGYPADRAGLLSISQTLYDVEGRAVVSVGPLDPNKSILPTGTETVYDALGRVTQTRRWAQVQITMADLTDTYGNLVGRKATGWTASGAAPIPGNELSYTRTEYDLAGRVWRTYSQNEEGDEICTAEFEYDLSGRQIRTVSLPGSDDQTVTETLYDGAQRIAVIDARNNKTEFGYDLMGRLHRIKSPKVDYIDNSQTLQSGPLYTHTGYDGLGNKSWTSQPVPQDLADNVSEDDITSYVYSPSGRLEQVSLPSVLIPAGEPGAGTYEYPVYRYIYDTYGNTVGILDPKSRLTVFKYDEQNQQTHRYLPFEVNPVQINDAASVYTALNTANPPPLCEYTYYDALNRISLSLDYKGQATGYFYNSQGRLEYKRYYKADQTAADGWNDNYPDTPAEEYYYTYDSLGRQKRIYCNQNLQQEYEYDVEGRVIRITTPQGIINYAYSPVTDRKVMTWTGETWETRDNEFEYLYDDLGQLSSVITCKRNGYPVEGLLDEAVIYAYNENGSLKSIKYPNGNHCVYWYDALDQISQMANFSAVQADPDNPNSAQILSQFEYAYYADGQKASVAETVGGLTRTVNWKYDNLNRLMEETVAGEYTNRYQYDLSGNRRFLRNELDQILVEYTYNPQDHLLTEVSSGSTISYFYDENGSLIERVYGTNRGVDPNDQYIYNLQNQMAGFIPVGGSIVSYAYDPQGNRVDKTVDSDTTEYLIDLDNFTGYAQILRETSGPSSTVYLIGADVHGQAVNQSNPEYMLCDSHGSVRQLSGADVEDYFYDAYGNLLVGISDNPSTQLLYTGEQLDSDTGLYNLRARDYDPLTGRFNTRDIYPGQFTDPLTLHKYTYCHANPINRIDPSGQSYIEPSTWEFIQSLEPEHALRILIGIRVTYTMGRAYIREQKRNPEEVDINKQVERKSKFDSIKEGIDWIDDFLRRPDIADRIKGDVYEVRPDNPTSITKGQADVLEYIQILQRRHTNKTFFPGAWQPRGPSYLAEGIPGLLGMKPLKITARNAGGGVIAYRIDDKDLKDRVSELVDMLAIAGIASAGIQFNQAITMAQTFNVAEVAIQRAVMVPMMERARVEQYRGVVTTNAMIGKF